MVFMCYAVVGTMGYFAFAGSDFKNVYFTQTSDQGIISQNFLNMFTYDQAPAILVRTMIYIQLSCSYPLVNHFQRVILFNLIWKTPNVSDYQFRMMNICISTVPLCFALFYPKIGSILGYAASVSGFLMIYVVPVLAYMKMREIEIKHPLLAQALQENEVELFVPDPSKLQYSPKAETGDSPLL